jgi:imidazolonepropionase-like amidohydrolase
MYGRDGWIIGGSVVNTDGSMCTTDIRLEDGVIVALGIRPAGDDHDVLYDAGSKYVLPGLIDLHSHLTHYQDVRHDSRALAGITGAYRARLALECGITTVRDIGSHRRIDVAVRDAIRLGYADGPSMLCAGSFVAMTGGHDHVHARVADGPAEVRKAVREQLALGVDWIKLMGSGGFAVPGENPHAPQLSLAEMSAAIDEAGDAGVPVAVHAHSVEAIKRALTAGARSIEHGSFVNHECAELLMERDAFVVPTFAVYQILADSNPRFTEHTERVLAAKIASFEVLRETGAQWGFGSDCGASSPVVSFIDELVFARRTLQLEAAEVLHKATAGNAALLGLHDRGTVEVGKRADLIVTGGNPLQDLNVLRHVEVTVVGGRCYRWPVDAGVGAGATRAQDPGRA